MKKIPTLLSALCLLSACSPAQHSDDPFEARDSIEPLNRKIFAFNLLADKYVMRPVENTYHYIPLWGRAGISNVLTNLSEPINTFNGILQLNPKVAFTSFWRFTLNTTFGLGGIRDFAGENGLHYQDTNFGKTLGAYAVPDGSYVVLPLVGPSTTRDTAGQAVDWFLDPVGWFLNTPENIGLGVANAVATRDEQNSLIDQLYYQSLDPYVATRAAYLQHEITHP